MLKIILEQLEAFKNYLIDEEKSPCTIEKYIRDVSAFKKWSENKEISKNLVLCYKNELCEKYAPKSVNSILSSLNCFFEFIGCHDLKVKALKIQKQIFVNHEKELTKPEYERLLKAAQQKKNKRLYYLMQTICSTGIRISEDI